MSIYKPLPPSQRPSKAALSGFEYKAQPPYSLSEYELRDGGESAYHHQHQPSMAASPERIITYVPKAGQGSAADQGWFRRSVSFYTNQLGMEFSLVLFLSLVYQGLVAVYIAFRAVRDLPLFSWLSHDNQVLNVVAYTGAVITALFFQGLVIAELAQVVWLRRTDLLKIKLMSDSIWWWVHLVILMVVVVCDGLILFLAFTGTTNLVQGWRESFNSNLTFLSELLLMLFNFLTLLRCASVMRTSTNEENKRELEERLGAIADEMLLDAGDATRLQAREVWKKLGADPRKFIPLQNSVLSLVRERHPHLFPPSLGGDTWAYDLGGNTLAALPPDLHLALTQARQHTNRFSDESQRMIWKLAPHDLAELVDINLETYGQPRYVNLTDLSQPQYAYQGVDFTALENSQEPAAAATSAGASKLALEKASERAPDPASAHFADLDSFLIAIPNQDKVRFASFLKKNYAAIKGKGEEWTEAGVDIWQVFDLVELQYLYRRWLAKTGRLV